MSEAATESEKKEDQEGAEKPAGEAGSAEAAPAKKSSMKLIIIIVGALVVLGGGAAAFLFLTSMGRHMIGLDKDPHAAKLPEHIAYYELPEMLVNIQSTEKRRPYLRVMIQLELHKPDDVPGMDMLKPRIIDTIQVYLRELRVEDLEGSAGSQRLKQELLKRVRTTAAPIEVADVLFTNFVVQ